MSVVHLLRFDSNFQTGNFAKKTKITNEWIVLQKELNNINILKKIFKILKYNSIMKKTFNLLKPKKKSISSSFKKNTLVDFIIQVLSEENDLHYTNIKKKVLALGYITTGKTFDNTIRSRMGERPHIFELLGNGYYHLKL